MEENKELETVTESQRNAGKGLFLSGIIVGFAATLLVVGGIFIAFQIHRIVTVKDDVSAQVSYDEGSAVNAQTIKKLQLLEDTVKENFYLSEVTNEQLEDGMYRGLMEALDDPYSEYYTAEELNELTEQTQGIYYGIGAYVSMDSDTNLPKISGVIEGAPAADVDLLPTLEQAGIPTAYFEVSTFEDYLAMLEVCTRVTGRPELYEQYGEQVRAQVDAAVARAEGKEGPSVLYLRATGSSCKVKNSENSVLGEMLAALGCVNIADSDASLLEELSMEAILAADPERIFIVMQGSDQEKVRQTLESAVLSNPAWQQLSAVKNGRVYYMDQQLYNLKPNARWGEAYEKLAEILYGEA